MDQHNEIEKMIATVPKNMDGSQLHSAIGNAVRAELLPLVTELKKLIAELKDIKKKG